VTGTDHTATGTARLRGAATRLGASARPRRWGAVRAAAAIGVPLVAGAAVGHVQEGGQAALGSFVALYAADAPYRRRAWLLGLAAVVLAAVTALGTAVAGSVVATCVAGGALGVLVTLGALALRVGPPREYFVLLTFLLATSLPVDPGSWASRGGLVLAGGAVAWLIAMSPWVLRRPGPEAAAVRRARDAVARLTGAVGTPDAPAAGHDAIVAVRTALEATDGAIGATGLAWSRRVLAAELVLEAALALEVEGAPPLDEAWTARLRAEDATPSSPPPVPALPAGPRLAEALERTEQAWSPAHDEHPDEGGDGPAPLDPRWRAPLRWSVRRGSPHLRTAARLGLAVLGGLVVGHALGLDHPSWVAVSAAAVLQGASVTVARRRALHRVGGTLVGVLVAGAVLALDPSDGAKILLIVVLQLGIELVIVASYGLAVSGITPLVLLLISVSGAGRSVEGLLDARLLDTVVGVAVAALVLLATRPRRGRGALPVAQAEALRAASAVILAALRPAATRHDLLAGRRRVHDAILQLRGAEDDAIGDVLRRDPRADARWPVTATVDRLARLSLTIPTAPERPALDAEDETRLRDVLNALARRVAGERDVADPGPLPAIAGLPRTSATIARLREQVAEVPPGPDHPVSPADGAG